MSTRERLRRWLGRSVGSWWSLWIGGLWRPVVGGWRRPSAISGVLAICACLAFSAQASAGEPLSTLEEFPFQRDPRSGLGEIALDSEENAWFFEYSDYLEFHGGIFRISPNGIITGGAFLPEGYPTDIARGVSSDMWFTDDAKPPEEDSHIGRITPAGAVEEFPIPNGEAKPFDEAIEGPIAIAMGADRNMWFTDGRPNRENKIFIGRITAAGSIKEFPIPLGDQPDLPVYSYPYGIAQGADGNMWFTDQGHNEEGRNLIGRITPTGAIAEFPIPTPNSGPTAIALGSDGNMWFTEARSSKIGSITPAGYVTEYPVPSISGALNGIVAGGDGYMWYTGGSATNALGWIAPDGAVRTLSSTAIGGASPWSLAAGANDQIWFTDPRPTEIGNPAPSFLGHFVAPFAPTIVTAPLLSGQALEGKALSVSEGSWMYNPTAAASYRWERCDAAGLGCQDIGGEVGATYSLSSADVGHTLRAVVTAGNAIGTASAASSLSPVVQSTPPSPVDRVSSPPVVHPPVVATTLTWRFLWTSKYTIVKSLVAHAVPAGALVEVLCRGMGCPFSRSRSSPSIEHRVCHAGRCARRRVAGARKELDLSGRFKAARLKPGAHISITIVKAGWVGRSFLFTLHRDREPSVNVICLAPGSTSTGAAC